jgi:PadR family transcriptional regulator PadR
MPRRPHSSPQTVSVLETFASSPRTWRYGLSLAQALELQSGTLYPLLVRLSEAGLLESKWQASEHPGCPQRHVYRLTPAGLALARERAAEASGRSLNPRHA